MLNLRERRIFQPTLHPESLKPLPLVEMRRCQAADRRDLPQLAATTRFIGGFLGDIVSGVHFLRHFGVTAPIQLVQ